MSKLSTERAIDALDTVRAYYASLTAGYPKGKDCKAIGDVMCSEIANSCLMAIKALRQEPCEDCVNRHTVLNTLFYKSDNNCEVVLNKELQDRIKALPSVTPQPKTGHWITEIKSDLRGDMWPTNPKCSECGGEPYFSKTIYSYNFCPYCGAKMVEPQESEVKE